MINLHETSIGYLALNGCPQIIENILTDPNLDENDKQAFFDFVKEFDGTIDIGDYCKSFFYKDFEKYLKNGFSVSGEPLGHLVVEHTWLEYLYRKKPTIDIVLIKDLILANELDDLKDLCTGLPIREFLMWSFRYIERDNFKVNNKNICDLPCVLGLRANTPGRVPFVFLTHLFDTADVYKPTAFNAAMDEQWRCGGYTRPLDECLTIYTTGLEEIVHEPNQIDNLTLKIESIIYDYR